VQRFGQLTNREPFTEDSSMRQKSLRAKLITITAGVLAVLATAAPATADPGPPVKTGPPAAQAAPAGRPCVEHSGGEAAKDARTSCLGVTATLDRAPSFGETATLTVSVRASVQLAPADIKVELPTQLHWAQPPAGFAAGQETSVRPERSGTIAVAQRRTQLVPGRPETFTGVVRAVAPGYGQIQARAAVADGANVHAGQDDVFLTIGEPGRPSQFGAVAVKGDGTVATLAAAPKNVAARPGWQQTHSVGTAGLSPVTARRADGAALACDTRVTGSWHYIDETGAWRNAMNFQVQVRDLARGTLAVGLTDPGGNFNLCFDASVGTQLYLTLKAEVQHWRVQNGNDVFNWSTGVVRNPAAGSTVNFGWMSPGDPADHRAVHAFDEANDAWMFVPKVAFPWCFDPKDTVCRQLRINWSRDSTHRTEYDQIGNVVHLDANDPNGPMTVAHEIGHAVMDDVYNEAFPAAPNCQDHHIENAYSAGCGWIEGWADFFALSVYRTSVFRWSTGESLDLEQPTWGNGWAEGDINEGRVAGALLDIADSNNEGVWDRSSEGFTNIWYTFTHHVDADFRRFWADRASDGFNTSDTGALATLYQNTIDLGFRDPLADRAMLLRPKPTPHNYSFSTATAYWSVVGVLPNSTSDEDLQLFDDRAGSVNLGGSNLRGRTTDFVAIDSNRRPVGDYYPRVGHFGGPGGYVIQVAQGGGADLVAGKPMTVNMPNDLIAVRDTLLSPGVTVTITVTPGSAAQDVDVFLMGSVLGSPSTYVRGRANAVATGAAGGPGATETLTYTSTTTAFYGVVITQRSATGSVTLTRS
jgi:hypothetical protein